ncbi:peptidoglycan-binding domain-containing protein [Bradyrhizobium oligotrophicum]|uniref:peptidoglycan-binding domain-containing protein n=1 Tax=Bradyrhizobium oligotrophicum TaxID=44255 RepID=UPI003EC13CED
MRALIMALSVLAIVGSADVAEAGLSSKPRNASAPVDAAAPAETSAPADASVATGDATKEAATSETEDQLGLTGKKRREVQRRLTRLGFGTKVTGKFDDSTRAVIARWQEERGYPSTGFLDAAQHKVLMDAGTVAGKSDRPASRRAESRGRRSRGVGGPIGAIGGAMHSVVGGIFGR